MLNRPLIRLMMTLVLVLFGTAVLRAEVVPQTAVMAIERAVGGNFAQAYDLAEGDAVTSDLITWIRLRKGGSPFGDYALFAAARPGWPNQDRLRARAEEMLFNGPAVPNIHEWFQGYSPQTGEGAVVLAQALIQQDRAAEAHQMLADIWLTSGLSEDGHAAMIAAFPEVLAPLHVARVDALLWRWRTEEAKRMAPLLDAGHTAWLNARVALIRKTGQETEALADVPQELQASPGLIYDRYNWLADKGRRGEAIALLRGQSTSPEHLGEPFRWSGWRRSLARWEMREGRIDVAYELAARHHLTEGSAFADLEWLAGYLALTYQGAPTRALTHFEAALGAVDSPISVGRMAYWQGRAHEALGNSVAATAAYAQSAQHQTSFYGLLASEKVSRPLAPGLTGANDPTDWQEADLLSNDLIRAGVTLLAAGERGAAVPFFVSLGKTLGRDDLARLGALLSEMEAPYFEVLLGKTAVARGVLVPSIYFPLHDLATMDLDAPAALSLSIARRESEFNAGVGSPVGALGLMQLMPATAQEVAGLLDLPYSRPRLTGDWRYNARLGAKYLSMLADEFGSSPVQIAAGYNAGPSRPKTWMFDRGDPRVGEVDVIDWIEHIPFRETRNYVMRVTESIPIYEARLTGRTGPVRFTQLLIGDKPLARPKVRPQIWAAPITSLRPSARPEG